MIEILIGVVVMKTNHQKNRRKIVANRGVRKAAHSARKPAAKTKLQGVPKGRAKPGSSSIKRKANPDALSDMALDFMDQADEILKLYSKRGIKLKLQESSESPYSRPIGEFKRQAYNLIRRAISSSGGHRIIKSIHHHMVISHEGPSYPENQFYWGLLAMDVERSVLTAHEVGLFARQMLYAHRHGIPPCLLVGFLYQTGIASSISREQSVRGKEPWGPNEIIGAYVSDV